MKKYCQCGKEGSEHADGGNVGMISKETGFRPIFLEGDGIRFAWLCPDCATKAEELALQLRGITKNENVRIYQLISKEKRKQ